MFSERDLARLFFEPDPGRGFAVLRNLPLSLGGAAFVSARNNVAEYGRRQNDCQ